MEKMKSTAKKLDVFFNICQVCSVIALVASGVFLVLTIIVFIFKLDPDLIGSGYHELDIGFLKLQLNESVCPTKNQVLSIASVGLFMGGALAFCVYRSLALIRKILAPMKDGAPFSNTHIHLRHLAVYALILGVISNLSGIVELYLVENVYHLTGLFMSEKFISVALHYEFNISFIAVSAVLLLLSYIFHYGQELQTLSDETL